MRKSAFPVLVLCYLVIFCWGTKAYFVDDAYIGFRCAENLTAGRGPVFNPGDRVESVTNIGWVLLLALPGTAIGLPVASKLLGFLLLVSTLLLLHRLSARTAPPGIPGSRAALAPVLLAASSFPLLYFSVGGMETGLLAGLLVALPLAGEGAGERLEALVGAAVFTVHPEAVLVYPLAMGLLVLSGARSKQRVLSGLAVYAVALGAIEIARFATFGSLLPNTFGAKKFVAADALERLSGLLRADLSNISSLFSGPLGLLLLAGGCRSLSAKHPVTGAYTAAACATAVAFAVYAAPDWTVTARYSAPYVPLLALAAWHGALVALARLSPGARRIAGGALLALAVATGASETSGMLSPESVTSYPGYVMFAPDLPGPSRWLGQHTKAGSTIATRRIGAVAYFSHRRVFDYAFGLPHPEVARLFQSSRPPFALPTDPALAELWRREKPDYLLEDLDLVGRLRTPGGMIVHGVPYRLEGFFPVGRSARWALCRKVDG